MYRDYIAPIRKLHEELNDMGVTRVTISQREAELAYKAQRIADLLGGDWPHIEGASPELTEAVTEWRAIREI